MRITPSQAAMLFQVLADSLRISDRGMVFQYTIESRRELAERIVMQQGNQLPPEESSTVNSPSPDTKQTGTKAE